MTLDRMWSQLPHAVHVLAPPFRPLAIDLFNLEKLGFIRGDLSQDQPNIIYIVIGRQSVPMCGYASSEMVGTVIHRIAKRVSRCRKKSGNIRIRAPAMLCDKNMAYQIWHSTESGLKRPDRRGRQLRLP